jgi:hypothetical protein
VFSPDLAAGVCCGHPFGVNGSRTLLALAVGSIGTLIIIAVVMFGVIL